MYIIDMISQQYECACSDEGKYRLQTTKAPSFAILPYTHLSIPGCYVLQVPVLGLSLSVEPWRLSDRYRWSGGKVGSVHSRSICQPSICLSWLPALAVAGPRGVRAFKEGEKMKSNLQSASPKEVRVPAERTKEAAWFLRQDQDCIDPVAASQCSHLSKCPESLYLLLKQICIIDYLRCIGLNLKPG